LKKLEAHDVNGADQSITIHLASVMGELDIIRNRHPEYFMG
jgi:hypothetical protein